MRSTDVRCAFCGAALPGDESSRSITRTETAPRALRAAALALGASVALAACGASTSPADGAQDTATAQDVTGSDTIDDDVNFLPPYGVPPMDAGLGE